MHYVEGQCVKRVTFYGSGSRLRILTMWNVVSATVVARRLSCMQGADDGFYC